MSAGTYAAIMIFQIANLGFQGVAFTLIATRPQRYAVGDPRRTSWQLPVSSITAAVVALSLAVWVWVA